MSDWLYPVIYFAIGVPLGLLTGKALSGKSEEAVAWTFVMMFMWIAVLPLMLLLASLAGLGWLVDQLGIENARSDNRGV